MRLILWAALFCAVIPLAAGESRTAPIDMYLIIDGSTALQRGKNQAVQWLCGNTVDGLLQEGDRLTIWIAAEKAEKVFSGTLTGAQSKDEIKTLLQAITLKNGAADYIGALREASELIGQETSRISYTLLVSGGTGSTSSAKGAEITALLRYSLIRDFTGWRAIVTAPDIGSMVQQAAAAYMNR
ncbi:MAG: hypothetical protein LBG76_05040 [Treponema sp.]|nr:hypothetical protein [Treponema sp.]